MAITEEIEFRSQRTTCAGTLMLPKEAERPPVIVMAHGFGAIRQARLPVYAGRFVDAGYAVFLFDYRTFGDSGGEPRHWVDPKRQIADWNAAIDYVRTRPEINPDRVVLWGTSYSGGHVLSVAASRDDLAAVISQLPHVSGLATVLQAPLRTVVLGTIAAALDLVAGLFGKTFYSRVIAEPGERAAITRDGATEAYVRMIPEGANWDNKVLSRSLIQVLFYTPRRDAHRINAPTFIIAASRDTVVSTPAARRIARKIPNSTFKVIDGDHFEPYFGECFEENISMQLEFLRSRVPVHENHQ